METDGDDDIWSYFTSSLICMHTDCDCCQCIFPSLNRSMFFMDAPTMTSMTIIVILPKTATETLCIQRSLWVLMLFVPRHIQSNFCSACVWSSEMVQSLADKFQGSGVEKMYFRMKTLFTGFFSPVGLVLPQCSHKNITAPFNHASDYIHNVKPGSQQCFQSVLNRKKRGTEARMKLLPANCQPDKR